MRCPGQDRRYWKEDAVYDVPCPECGAAVEFFKDEPTGRCPQCGFRFRNPGIDYGCAAWCALAEKCLGIAPETASAARAKEGALAGRLIQQIRTLLAGDSVRLTRALKTYHFAKDLVAKEGGNPRLTLAAALLTVLGKTGECPAEGQGDTAGHLRQLLQEANVDETTAGEVAQLLADHWAGKPPRGIEAKVLRDADTLARLTSGDPAEVGTDGGREVVETLLTGAGRQRACQLFPSAAQGPKGQET